MRVKQSLNGWWDYRIGNGPFTKKKVPYSALPVGRSECVLTFNRDAEGSGKRAFLVFDGITYEARVSLNGSFLGKMLPYCEYRFEVTDLLEEEGNTLSVEIRDIEPAFGPAEGWENYGGIIRDVCIEYTNSLFAEDIVWSNTLSNGYKTAECSVKIAVNGIMNTDESSISTRAVLKDSQGMVVGEGMAADGDIKFMVNEPKLWSPKDPNLYTLECSVFVGDQEMDRVTQKVGFKEFVTKGKRFYLNGEPFFILGVNRHDLWGKDGHTLSEEQMQKDMRMIKENGMNYVRLVHYPHNKRIVEIADEIGLLVSEEPGLWWSDMHNQEICDGALEVMRRTVLRDRNHISIAFWLSFNECEFTLEYLKDSARVCRENDPYHMVSGANCMSIEMTKENFPYCGFDFYTMHPYAPTPDRMKVSAEKLTEMPLLFTEWGGFYVHDNPNLFRMFIEYIISTWHNTDEDPVIAGAVYWYWAENWELGRGNPACIKGVLKEALVDMDRNPTPNLEVFRTAFSALNLPVQKQEGEACYSGVVLEAGNYEAVNVAGLELFENREAIWEEMIQKAKEEPNPKYTAPYRKYRKIEVGPVLCEEVKNIGTLPVDPEMTPYVVTDQLEVPIGRNASAVYVLGNTSMTKGFPLEGSDYGEAVAKYTVCYTDGTTETRIMRNGEDITTAAANLGPSRIEPYAANSPRIIRYNYDANFEHYVVNLHRMDTNADKTIASFKIHDVSEGYYLLFYGITIKK